MDTAVTKELEADVESVYFGEDHVVETHELTKTFGQTTAVDHISLYVPKGTIFGFIGPSGCGKTTTVRMMVGTYGPTEGEVRVFGREPLKFSRPDRERLGYLPQLFVLYPDLTVWENLNFAASLYAVSWRRKKRLQELLDLVELRGHEKKRVENISGGMQRRLSLTATLIHKPELLFLDEPTAGIDPVLRRKLWDHFRQLQSEGRTLFVTTQYVGEAVYCDLVGVMANGRLLMVETPDNLRRRALGGQVVNLHAVQPLRHPSRDALRELDFVQRVTLRDAHSVQIVVNDASKAIPHLISWCEAQGIEVESINEFVPPFDDVFVKLMEDNNHAEEEQAT